MDSHDTSHSRHYGKALATPKPRVPGQPFTISREFEPRNGGSEEAGVKAQHHTPAAVASGHTGWAQGFGVVNTPKRLPAVSERAALKKLTRSSTLRAMVQNCPSSARLDGLSPRDGSQDSTARYDHLTAVRFSQDPTSVRSGPLASTRTPAPLAGART